MSITRHGLSIGFERINEHFFLTIKATGTLTHEDYERISPIIDNALAGVTDTNVRMLIDGTEFEGWELRAAWDDFKLGLKHGSQFEKVAIYGNRSWQELVAKVGNWFIAGDAEYFEDYKKAVEWLHE